MLTRRIPGNRESRAVRGLFALSFGFLTVRSFIGTDLVDGNYPIVLARRVAHGAMPLRDEQALHVFGSLPAVPFTMAWEAMFGTSGLILASRLFAVGWILVVVLICQRALAPSLSPLAVAAGLCGVTLALPYSVIGTTYNTVAMFGLLLATCAGFAALLRGGRAWIVTASIAAPIASIVFPGVTPGAVSLMLALLVGLRLRRSTWRVVLRDLVLPASLVALALLAFLAIGPGIGGARQAVEDQRRIRPSAGGLAGVQELGPWLTNYLTQPGKLPLALVAALLAALLPWRRVAAVSAVSACALLLWFASAQPGPNLLDLDRGTYPGAMGTLAAVILLPVALRAAVNDRRYRPLLALGGSALPAVIGVQAMTASGTGYGAMFVGAAPFALAVFTGFALFLSEPRGSRVWRFAGAGPVLVSAVALTAVVFSEGTTFQPRTQITSGPAAGLWVSESSIVRTRTIERMVAQCPEESSVLLVGSPGAYLWFPAHSAAIGSWLSVEVLEGLPLDRQLSRRADCILVTRREGNRYVSADDERVLSQLLAGMRPAGPPVFLDRYATIGSNYLQAYVPAR